jgi:hypothetical protein
MKFEYRVNFRVRSATAHEQGLRSRGTCLSHRIWAGDARFRASWIFAGQLIVREALGVIEEQLDPAALPGNQSRQVVGHIVIRRQSSRKEHRPRLGRFDNG